MNTINLSHNRWCGAKRGEVSYLIYEILKRKGLTGQLLANQLGISRQSVCRAINGITHSSKVLDALREAGVPEDYLFDPKNIKYAEVEISHKVA